jgi:uncharacterized protein with PIN domain
MVIDTSAIVALLFGEPDLFFTKPRFHEDRCDRLLRLKIQYR